MNFYSHAAIATLFTEQARVAFGSMLPDLASLIGGKPPTSSDPMVLEGYDLHHATDRAFHSTSEFRATCSIESRELQSQGIPKGPALAAAHVGVELALDAALSDDEPTKLLFRRALNIATPEWMSFSILWPSTKLAIEFDALRLRLQRFSESKPGQGRLTLADRICRTLSNRPRLAVRASDRATIHTWAEGLSHRCDSLWSGLVDAVLTGLAEADWHARTDLRRTLRFRRACGGEL